jgi:hypothetical protein
VMSLPVFWSVVWMLAGWLVLAGVFMNQGLTQVGLRCQVSPWLTR